MAVGTYSSIEEASSATTGVPGRCSRALALASTGAREECVQKRFGFCHWQRGEVRDGSGLSDEPEGIPLRHMRLRNQSERFSSYLSNVSTTSWNPRRYEPRGAEMAATAKTPEDKGDAQQRDQRDLTTSVGTPLVRQEKKSRRRLFGRSRKTPTTSS